MNVLIIEDEQPAARRLSSLVLGMRPGWKILDVIDSVEASVKWLRTFPAPDLMLMDIQLADGLSFDIFRHTEVKTPIIFTTAYDEFTLKAFKVNSVDYLLKPIDQDELSAALHKFDSLRATTTGVSSQLEAFIRQLSAPAAPTYKERLLVRSGPQMSYVLVGELAYLYSDDGLTFGIESSGKRHILEYTLDEAEVFLQPRQFFRINRKFLVQLTAIQRIHAYFNSRLKIDLHPVPSFDVIVSRERVNDFKAWLDA